MLLKKEGYPEDDELVLCSVTGVNPHSVFCTLDEYGGKTGMIHISEVAPGRIRNIREFVQEGKKIVCKVLKISQERGHIDLSLRRVNESIKRKKLNEIKQEQLAEKIIEQAAKQLNTKTEELYQKIAQKIIPDYGTIFPAFEEVVNDSSNLEEYLDKKTADVITDLIKSRIKPPEVHITGKFTMTSYASDGAEQIKNALAEAKNTDIKYLGAGTYHLQIIAEDYKTAEKLLKEAVEPVLAYAEKHQVQASWQRAEE
ncbi:translation initiation factor IF-2 subunit alpha [Candidatus Woesearchaeota archaeon CG10_big_fil_rev_8_21_14_0_10_37_12]|nr:MAG: translation initiation factor IF-2 subunit alpha [Candidatus Woesearchaeota archaeon CG10_big_fil_rev_8_21_14_0_10_37_12]